MSMESPKEEPSAASDTPSVAALVVQQSTSDESAPNLSKNQRKKLLKQEKVRLARKVQKKVVKERKKEEAELRRQERAFRSKSQQESDPTMGEGDKAQFEKWVDRKNAGKEEYIKRAEGRFSIIIDCAWENQHSEGTLKSLSQQIMHCYGYSRKHSHPAPIYLTGLQQSPNLRSRLEVIRYDNWVGVERCMDDYITHSHFSVSPASLDSIGCARENESSVTDSRHAQSITSIDNGEQQLIDEVQLRVKRKQLVYLTSDAEDTLETLDDDCAYIIGGIVDRNAHKGATYGKACAQGVRTAKLPIRENFQHLATTHVLAVNHVVAILLCYAQLGSWPAALGQVLPKRKAAVGSVYESATSASAGASAACSADSGAIASVAAADAGQDGRDEEVALTATARSGVQQTEAGVRTEKHISVVSDGAKRDYDDIGGAGDGVSNSSNSESERDAKKRKPAALSASSIATNRS